MEQKKSTVAVGLLQSLFAGLMFSFMASGAYAVHYFDPSFSPIVVSFIRTVVNLAILVAIASVRGEAGALWGDKSASLWFRGLFGGLALMTYFASLQMIGMGRASFIQQTNGVFIILLAPLVLNEKFSLRALASVAVSFVGLYFIFDLKSGNGTDIFGSALALISGIFAAFSGLLVAKAGKKNTAMSIVFYFCIVSVFVHGAVLLAHPVSFVTTGKVWIIMIGVGLAATCAQYFISLAYQNAPASLLASLGYLGPVTNTIFGAVLFGQTLSTRAFLGCAIIFVSGALLPYLHSRRIAVSAEHSQ